MKDNEIDPSTPLWQLTVGQYEALMARHRELLVTAVREARDTQAPEWLTVANAAEELGCSEKHVRNLARRGQVESKRYGRSIRVRLGS